MSGGQILGWLNSDDTYQAGAVKKIVNFFLCNPHISVVYGQCDYIDKYGHFIRAYPARKFDFLELIRTSDNFIPQPAVFFRKQVLNAVGYLDESLHYVMDLDYWMKIGLQYHMAFFPVKVAMLRLHEMAKSIGKMIGFAEEFIQIYQHFFGSAVLPDDICKIKDEAMSNIFYRAASYAYWAGRFNRAWYYGLQAWRFQPFCIKPLYFFFLLRGFGLALAKKMAGNTFSGNLVKENSRVE
jgi:hypothetical protein